MKKGQRNTGILFSLLEAISFAKPFQTKAHLSLCKWSRIIFFSIGMFGFRNPAFTLWHWSNNSYWKVTVHCLLHPSFNSLIHPLYTHFLSCNYFSYPMGFLMHTNRKITTFEWPFNNEDTWEANEKPSCCQAH